MLMGAGRISSKFDAKQGDSRMIDCVTRRRVDFVVAVDLEVLLSRRSQNSRKGSPRQGTPPQTV
jgi:hypothetical protein